MKDCKGNASICRAPLQFPVATIQERELRAKLSLLAAKEFVHQTTYLRSLLVGGLHLESPRLNAGSLQVEEAYVEVRWGAQDSSPSLCNSAFGSGSPPSMISRRRLS